MSIHLSIPDSVAQALRLPQGEQQQRLASELAVTLYAQGILPFGKARELAGMTKYEFGILLGKRQVVRHYTDEDLQDDVAYAHRK
jgi:predicted HTH domain antitoxin